MANNFAPSLNSCKFLALFNYFNKLQACLHKIIYKISLAPSSRITVPSQSAMHPHNFQWRKTYWISGAGPL